MVTARTLAQQLDLPLFGISSLAAVAWSQRQGIDCALAVTLPAQRGEVFAGIYAPTPEGTGLIPQLPDRVFTLADWQQTLITWPHPVVILQAEGGLGATVISVLELAAHRWLQGDRPHWSGVLPFYGQQPVATTPVKSEINVVGDQGHPAGHLLGD